ncbi:hypothetical protein KR032_002743, partial [Drosophila birchii]
VCCEDLVNNSGLELLKENEPTCGKFRVDTVVGGHEIRMGSRPWMALLEYNDTEIRFKCGATLITPREISVRLGEHSISTEEDCKAVDKYVHCLPAPQDIAIEDTIVHKDFNTNIYVYDIALIRLKTPAMITREFSPLPIVSSEDCPLAEYVRTICLPLYEDVQHSIRRRTVQHVTGWGVQNDGKQSDVPNEAFINRLPPNACHFGRHIQLLENQMCFNASHTDSCAGDSGGPLSFPYIYQGAQRFVQMGIVSYGHLKCGTGEAAVYTNVISFLPWITQHIMP